MQRYLLVFLLVFGLCQGLFYDARENFLFQAGSENQELKESIAAGDVLTQPSPSLRFNRIFAAYRQQQQNQPVCLRLPAKPSFTLLLPFRHRPRLTNDSVLPQEWGVDITRFPRSDG